MIIAERTFKIQRLNPPAFDVIAINEDGSEQGRTSFFSLTSALNFVRICKEIDEEQAEVCEFCEGEGEVPCMEYVYAGEPHQAMIGTQKCICQVREDFEE